MNISGMKKLIWSCGVRLLFALDGADILIIEFLLMKQEAQDS